jgi:hypothetical protein
MRAGSPRPALGLASHRLSRPLLLEMSQPAWPSPPGSPEICGT